MHITQDSGTATDDKSAEEKVDPQKSTGVVEDNDSPTASDNVESTEEPVEGKDEKKSQPESVPFDRLKRELNKNKNLSSKLEDVTKEKLELQKNMNDLKFTLEELEKSKIVQKVALENGITEDVINDLTFKDEKDLTQKVEAMKAAFTVDSKTSKEKFFEGKNYVSSNQTIVDLIKKGV